jgi:feruloyl esterase
VETNVRVSGSLCQPRSELLRLAMILLFLAGSATRAHANAGGDACAALNHQPLHDARILTAETVTDGSFTPPGAAAPGGPGAQSFARVPPFCRVVAELTPSSDSRIKIEVWMPATGWNGKLRGLGNDGFAGGVDYTGLAFAVSHGYAAAATDAGHTGSPIDATWAVGHPEKVVDFGFRAIHEMTLDAKLIVEAFYARPPAKSYFVGCSDGGREGLMEAQRYPKDYNGILAGAPANNWTHMLANGLSTIEFESRNPATYIPASKIAAISAAVDKACDAQDGVADGVLNDPRQCRFDPQDLLCKGTEGDNCLTSSQVTGLRELYAGGRDGQGNLIFPGYLPGGETGSGGWGGWITGPKPGQSLMMAFTYGYFSDIVYNKPSQDPRTLDTDDALRAAQARTGSILDATNPDLSQFAAAGGKVILYHGWSDPAISPLNTINYLNSVKQTTMVSAGKPFIELYMVPGMQHCGGGPGADNFGESPSLSSIGNDTPDNDISLAMEQWVETGRVPQKILASKLSVPSGEVSFSRPLCPYPKVATYNGASDNRNAAAFICSQPTK